MIYLHERMLSTHRGSNPQSPGHQSDEHATELPRPAGFGLYLVWRYILVQNFAQYQLHPLHDLRTWIFMLTLSCWINLDATSTSNFKPIRFLDLNFCYKFTYLMANDLQKPTDLDLHCLQRQGISRFSRTRVKAFRTLFTNPILFIYGAAYTIFRTWSQM